MERKKFMRENLLPFYLISLKYFYSSEWQNDSYKRKKYNDDFCKWLIFVNIEYIKQRLLYIIHYEIYKITKIRSVKSCKTFEYFQTKHISVILQAIIIF